jgi:hypothetical protein
MNEGKKGMPDILLQIYVNILIILTGGWGTYIRNSSICKGGVSKKNRDRNASSFYFIEKVKAEIPNSTINAMQTYMLIENCNYNGHAVLQKQTFLKS